MRIVGYARVSTGRQTEGSSLEAQAATNLLRSYLTLPAVFSL
jgi:DNA invertase Pin-like site-specific DNA recombinase